jgi:hypothetical protein
VYVYVCVAGGIKVGKKALVQFLDKEGIAFTMSGNNTVGEKVVQPKQTAGMPPGALQARSSSSRPSVQLAPKHRQTSFTSGFQGTGHSLKG